MTKTKLYTWSEWILINIFNMEKEGVSIYIACTNCNVGVRDMWEQYYSDGKNGGKILGVKRSRDWHKIELKDDQQAPEVGQSVDFLQCPNEKCDHSSLIRIDKKP